MRKPRMTLTVLLLGKSKVILIFFYLVGFVCIGYAQIGRGAAAASKAVGPILKKSAAEFVAEEVRLAQRMYQPLVVGDLQIGRALLQDKLPEIGVAPSYVRKAKWGERWLPKLPSHFAERLVAKHVLESAFPGYITDFGRNLYLFEDQSEFSLTRELEKVLNTYGPEAQFAGGFVPAFADAVGFDPVQSRWMRNATQALNAARLEGTQQRHGFFVVSVESPLIIGGKDVLLLDMKDKRFISLAQSSQAIQPKKLAYEPTPVGDVKLGWALMENKLKAQQFQFVDPRNFPAQFADVKDEFGVREWIQILRQNYGYDMKFNAGFYESLEGHAELHTYLRPPSMGYYGGDHRRAKIDDLEFVLNKAVNEATEKRFGFLVVFPIREDPSIFTGYKEQDLLILDLKKKRFISLDKSWHLAEEMGLSPQSSSTTGGAKQ